MTRLAERHCAACNGDTPRLDDATIKAHLDALSEHWEPDGPDAIEGRFKFKNYYHTQAFVNAVAYIAHCEDHHPDITFGYNRCSIRLTTHAMGGLSDNDFICAAKIDRLLP
ncbi:4a-hydroxytetrahydrobiopterin dehydratase [Salinisphaera sp. T31B1]|uniref:4a-hydroxytetrahydrobiopterin dehydratase n=1 Tax=Salinisphaera sp. T31B1 TaxID=727963 RepID=UPI00333F44CC